MDGKHPLSEGGGGGGGGGGTTVKHTKMLQSTIPEIESCQTMLWRTSEIPVWYRDRKNTDEYVWDPDNIFITSSPALHAGVAWFQFPDSWQVEELWPDREYPELQVKEAVVPVAYLPSTSSVLYCIAPFDKDKDSQETVTKCKKDITWRIIMGIPLFSEKNVFSPFLYLCNLVLFQRW